MPIASTILMIRPPLLVLMKKQPAIISFQSNLPISQEQLQKKALQEFDNMVLVLKTHNINVIVIDDTKEPAKPMQSFLITGFSLRQKESSLFFRCMHLIADWKKEMIF
jgi:hypothetical protein